MLWMFAAACSLGDGDAPAGDAPVGNDADGDGYGASVDCDDYDSRVHPGLEETCGNGLDDNCNGTADGCEWSGEQTLNGTVLSGTEKNEGFGVTLAVCDANGDGVDDVVVGAPWFHSSTGAVLVFYGPINDYRDANDANYALKGAEAYQYTAYAVDCRGDLDGDGIADILVGAPTLYPPESSGGTVYVVPGGGHGSAVIESDALSVWTGSDSSDKLGYDLVAIAADDDETDELAAALGPNAPGTNHFGAVYVFDDAPPGVHDAADATAYIYGNQAGRVDFAVGNAGDLDGDGLEELVVTGTNYAVEEVLVFGAPFDGPMPKSYADIRIRGGVPGDVWTGIGHADLDNDGRDDLFFANPNDNNSTGAVYAFFSPIESDAGVAAANMTVIGKDWSYTGRDVISPGDIDGDGTADLLIGAPSYTLENVYLQYNAGAGVYNLGSTAQASWQGSPGSSPGNTVAAGDVTGDGIVEFLIASPSGGDSYEGIVTIVPSWQL